MKSKLMIASLLLAGACAANLNAQEKTNYYTPKWSDNIFVSVGGGIHAINNEVSIRLLRISACQLVS